MAHQGMKIDKLLQLIESKDVTTDDFNLFIEDLPSSRVDLARQHMRVDPDFEKPEDPGTTAKTITRQTGESDPTTTAQGRSAGKRSRRKLKSKYGAAVEFIDTYKGKPLVECKDALRLQDKESLDKLVRQLLITPDHNISREWLWDIKSVL